MKQITLDQAIDIFGREELGQVFSDKVFEEYGKNVQLKVEFSNRTLDIRRKHKGVSQYLRLGDLSLTLGKKIDQSNKDLKRYSINLLKVRGKLKTSKGSFSDQQTEQAREHPIENLLSEKVQTAGSMQKSLCPFHNEKTPSFVIYKDNSFFCFGCGAHGANAIDFLIKRDQLTFKEAVGLLL